MKMGGIVEPGHRDGGRFLLDVLNSSTRMTWASEGTVPCRRLRVTGGEHEEQTLFCTDAPAKTRLSTARRTILEEKAKPHHRLLLKTRLGVIDGMNAASWVGLSP